MNRYFVIYHGLMATAPWGVAVECGQSTPPARLLMLCRTEPEAAELARLTGLGHGLNQLREGKVVTRAPATKPN